MLPGVALFLLLPYVLALDVVFQWDNHGHVPHHIVLRMKDKVIAGARSRFHRLEHPASNTPILELGPNKIPLSVKIFGLGPKDTTFSVHAKDYNQLENIFDAAIYWEGRVRTFRVDHHMFELPGTGQRGKDQVIINLYQAPGHC